ncbi:MAG: bifunctional oligoribonuclease/PAP phosphatase NrnA [Proteobacteria bacterium]|nr:bifunctional oligoribonuclease/PAP phosphatase NrnA [Pseudomonadota bacterium]MBU1737629.1 bifunctional oligoribonuclease/PAP phosphatase NrnA [Pseudomonadota bacterium]
MIKPPDEVVATIAGANRILLATHIYPDGDALGSQLALSEILKSLGKDVVLYAEEEVGHLYEFMPGCRNLVTKLPALSGFDCAVAVDCGDQARLGRERERLLSVHPFVMIDHHAGHKPFGDIQWVDSKRASTGEMICDLAAALKADISYEAAYCLYAAIVSDTGSFKYSSTTADTFRVAGELIGKGVKPSEVAGKLFDNFTSNRLQLLQMVLDSLELFHKNRVAVIKATGEMFARTGTVQADTENFINYPRSLTTVKVAVFIKESRDGMISVSLRSKGSGYDVARIAGSFGGGGHCNAAGFKLKGATVAEIQEKLLHELGPLVSEH